MGGLGEPLTFTQGAEVGNFFPDQCPPPTKNAVHWKTIDGKWDVLAYVFLCPREPTDRVTSFQLVFDRDEDRYWGTGDAGDRLILPYGCEVDGWSVASHEWGHVHGYADGADGQGHFPADAAICENNSDQHTMCPGYHPGSERMRTLEEHDKHTCQAAY